jgi:hypothetical protein
MIVTPDGEPIHVPEGWTTVELTGEEIEAEAASWCGKAVDLDQVALHLLRQGGIRIEPMEGTPELRCFTQIEKPVLVVRGEDGLTVHQGPRIMAS